MRAQPSPYKMKRSTLLRTSGASAVALAAAKFSGVAVAATSTKILLAEPQHNVGYMPIYVAIDQGLFKGLDVSTVTLASSGSAHSNAVITGRAWGFIGGPEHNAFADLRGSDIRAIAEVDARGNQYFVARKGLTPGTDMRAFWKGKVVVTGPYGSSPNNITRYVIAKLGLDAKTDVTLMEVENNAIPVLLSQGKGDIAGVREPILSRGIISGFWQEPFYSVPKVVGPYTFAAINTTYANIKDAPTCQAFVNGIRAAGELMKKNHDITLKAVKKEFPDLSDQIASMAVKSSYEDHMWSVDGYISPKAFEVALDVVKAGGSMPPGAKITYDQCVDMRFIPRVAKK